MVRNVRIRVCVRVRVSVSRRVTVCVGVEWESVCVGVEVCVEVGLLSVQDWPRAESVCARAEVSVYLRACM